MDDNENTPNVSCISDSKVAIAALVTIAALATTVMLYTGVGTEQIDLVFTGAICAIAGLVSTK